HAVAGREAAVLRNGSENGRNVALGNLSQLQAVKDFAVLQEMSLDIRIRAWAQPCSLTVEEARDDRFEGFGSFDPGLSALTGGLLAGLGAGVGLLGGLAGYPNRGRSEGAQRHPALLPPDGVLEHECP